MFEIFKSDKNLYFQIVLATLPVTVAGRSGLSALLAAVTAVLAATAGSVIITALKKFLNIKTAPFALLITAVGVVGVCTLLSQLFFPETAAILGFALALVAVAVPFTVSCDFCLNQSLAGSCLTALLLSGVQAAFMLACGIIREFFGSGSLFGLDIYTRWFAPISFFTTPAGGLLTVALLLIVYGLLIRPRKERKAER